MVCLTLLLAAVAQPALGSNWPEFQKDKINSGVTNDSAPIASPNTTISWAVDTVPGSGGWAGIDASPIVYNGSVYAVRVGSKLVKYSLDGTPAGGSWPVSFGNPSLQNAAPAAGNGKIYVLNTGYSCDPSSDLYAINPDDGSNTSVNVASRPIQFSSPITYAEDSNGSKHILFGSVNMSARDPVNLSDGGKYYCYNATTLSKEWERNCSSSKGYYWAGAAIIGNYAVYGDDAGHLVSVNYTNFANNQVVTIQEIDASTVFGFNVKEIRSSISYSADTGRIYFSSKAGYCYAIGFNASTGQFNTNDRWSCSIGRSTSTPAYYNGRIYVGSSGGLYCLNETNGISIWNNAVGSVQSSPAISTFYGPGNEYIYVTTNTANGGIYCVDSSGNTVWSEISSGSNKYCLAGAAISGGWVFYGNDDGYLHGRANWTRYDFNGSTHFNGSTGMWAYKYQVNGVPGTKNEPNEEFNTTEYNAIKTDDSVYASNQTTTENYSAAHRFVFKIDDNEKPWITSINVTWNGKAYCSGGTDGATLYIWNNTLSAYNQLNNGANGQNKFSLSGGVISNIGNYIDNSNNVTVLVVQNGKDDGLGTHSNIETDYVKLVVTP
ncbi:MAG: PQQ-binding-like beta-propeller repeat protein [Euryarchaeota archaeon]|nr:PQQ-binding-like beta-propeller repeat protein [Euryarchaeota archaeon]